MARYTALFLLPIETTKSLSEYGWIFQSSHFISFEAYNLLRRVFSMVDQERDEDYIRSKTDDLEIHFTLQSDQISEIYIKVYNQDILPKFQLALEEINSLILMEVFDPNNVFGHQ